MSASGTPSFQVGTTAGMITSGGKYNYTETAYGGNNQGRYATSNQVNFLDSTDNNFYLTGVQIEVGKAECSEYAAA